jgi:hypothetical protein
MKARSHSTFLDRFVARTRKSSTGCVEWQSFVNRGGYGRLYQKGKMHLAHRVSFELFSGPIPDGLCVLHQCDNPKCVSPSHIRLGTYRDNALEMYARGRGRTNFSRGVGNGSSRLTEDQVRLIRSMQGTGKTCKEIGDEFGISDVSVGRIWSRENWKHLS